MNEGHNPRNHEGKNSGVKSEDSAIYRIECAHFENKKIDWSKVKTIKDIKTILSQIKWYVSDDGSEKYADVRKFYVDE